MGRCRARGATAERDGKARRLFPLRDPGLAALRESPAEVDVVYRDPVSNVALRFWSAPHLPAWLAAGFLAGHTPWLPEVAQPLRWRVGAALAVFSGLAAPPGGALVAIAALIGAAGLGDRGRRARTG